MTPRVKHVTVQPEKLIYKVGETFDLNGRNRWIKSDINPEREQDHPTADHIVEVVYNNGSFVDLSQKEVQYQSSNTSVASISNDGIVKATGAGVATISAKVDGVEGSTVIVVRK